MKTPLIIARTDVHTAQYTAHVLQQGWALQEGFEAPASPWDLTAKRIVAKGLITTHEEIAHPVLLAARGAGILATVPDGKLAARLAADLQRIPHATVEMGEKNTSSLSAEQHSLLRRLASGQAIKAAAAAEFISLRTANRRLAAARHTLQVTTNREAIVVFVKQEMG